MSMLDKKKEKISALKYWLGIFVAVFLAIGAYLATNLRQIDDWLVLTGSLSLVGLFAAIVIVNHRISKHIDDLEDL
jgi:membrane protein YdbS with pleckstrin-like domain